MLDPKIHPPTTYEVTLQLRNKLKATEIMRLYEILNSARSAGRLTYQQTNEICEAFLNHFTSRTSADPLLPLDQALRTFLRCRNLPESQGELIALLKDKISNGYKSA